MTPKYISQIMSQMGRKGGKRRLETLTKEKRVEIATKASMAAKSKREVKLKASDIFY